FYGELDILTGNFLYVNAGHNPPLFLQKEEHTFLKASGPVVGIVPGAKYVSNQIQICAQDLLFLYTDGITESQNPQEEEFGEDGVIEFLRKHRLLAVDEMSALLESQIREFTKDAPPIDDATVVFVKRIA